MDDEDHLMRMARLQDAVFRMRHNWFMMARVERPSPCRDSYFRIMHFDYANFLSSMYNVREIIKAVIGKKSKYWMDLEGEIKKDDLLNYMEMCRNVEEHALDGSRARPYHTILGKDKFDGVETTHFMREPWGLRPITIKRDKVLPVPKSHRGSVIEHLTPLNASEYAMMWWGEVYEYIRSKKYNIPPPGLPRLFKLDQGYTRYEEDLIEAMKRAPYTSHL